jgi:hypothetical protein
MADGGARAAGRPHSADRRADGRSSKRPGVSDPMASMNDLHPMLHQMTYIQCFTDDPHPTYEGSASLRACGASLPETCLAWKGFLGLGCKGELLGFW